MSDPKDQQVQEQKDVAEAEAKLALLNEFLQEHNFESFVGVTSFPVGGNAMTFLVLHNAGVVEQLGGAQYLQKNAEYDISLARNQQTMMQRARAQNLAAGPTMPRKP